MIIIEGIDGTGKTTLADEMKKFGFHVQHSGYDNGIGLFKKFRDLLDSTEINCIVLDRSFITEVVYGSVIRNYSRINDKQFIQLLKYYSNKETILIYLFAEQNILLRRRGEKIIDKVRIYDYYDKIMKKYYEVINVVKNYFPVFEFNTGEKSINDELYIINEYLKGLVHK
jgi:thymidylate kinase